MLKKIYGQIKEIIHLNQFLNQLQEKNPIFLRNESNDSRELIQYFIDTIYEELNLNQEKEFTKNVEID